MLWLPSCDTIILSPDGDQAAWVGLRNSPSPVPSDPNLKANSPSAASNTWMRWLPSSATAIRSPDGE